MISCNNCSLEIDEQKAYQRKIYDPNSKRNYCIRVEYICNDCFPIVREKWIEERGGISLIKVPHQDLEKQNKGLKEELATERATNLEMLENLKVLNEQKYNERLEIALKEKTQRIKFLERLLFENSSQKKFELLEQKFNDLETKYSELVVNES